MKAAYLYTKYAKNLCYYESELKCLIDLLKIEKNKNIVKDIFCEMHQLENNIMLGRMINRGFSKEKINKYYSLMIKNSHHF